MNLYFFTLQLLSTALLWTFSIIWKIWPRQNWKFNFYHSFLLNLYFCCNKSVVVVLCFITRWRFGVTVLLLVVAVVVVRFEVQSNETIYFVYASEFNAFPPWTNMTWKVDKIHFVKWPPIKQIKCWLFLMFCECFYQSIIN